MNPLRSLLPLITATLLSTCLCAQKISTKRTGLHVDRSRYSAPVAPEMKPDTVLLPEGSVKFYGYEKQLRSSKETIFIENLTDSVLTNIRITIKYLDTSSRQIHRRSLWQNAEVRPREVRRIDIPSWDRQNSYYYLKGRQPRTSATPYDVVITADSVIIAPVAR